MKNTIERIHFIGIGGSGMSGIALVAHEQGLAVSGSDLKETRYMKALLKAGIPVTVGHQAANVSDPRIDVVVVSTAIPEHNPELLAARKLGLPIWQRAQMLAHLARDYRTLAVAGTHGKTTTSSMLGTTLDRLGASPTFLIGGVVDGYDATAYVGTGPWLVVEADESDGSFTWLDPELAIITNIECDHMDHYDSLEEIEAAFSAFLAQLKPEGIAVVCADDPQLPRLASDSGRQVITYGISQAADVRCIPSGREFKVIFSDGQQVNLALSSPGVHNMVNATAVLAALDALGFDRQAAALALSAFSGVRRRFDLIGEESGITVVDDYGHHPTEIAATLKAASELGYQRVHVLFQPHRYTRTEALLSQFALAFDDADTVSLLEVYSAGEAPIPGVNSEAILDAIIEHDPTADVRLVRHRPDAADRMAELAASGDLIITMGAGDITLIAPYILAALRQLRLELS